jgi:hypothetical protein
MTVQIFPLAGGTAFFDGVFIPVANLSTVGGITGASEFADSEAAAVKRDKALFAIASISNTALAARSTAGTLLGVTVTTPNFQSFTWTVSNTTQFYEKRNGSTPLAPLPVPTTGTNNGVGDFALTDIFAGAAKVASGATVAGSGVLIETAPLVRYGSPAHASLSVSGDNREYMSALFRWMASSSEVPLNSNSTANPVESAVTAKTASAPVIFTLPAAAIAATNPTTALTSADSDILVLISVTSSISFKAKTTLVGSEFISDLDSSTT